MALCMIRLKGSLYLRKIALWDWVWMDLLWIINSLLIFLMLIFMKICKMDKDRVKLHLRIVIGIISWWMNQPRRKSKRIELFLKIQIIGSKVSFQLDSEYNRRKEAKFLKQQLNLNYINNKNSKTFLILIFQR